MNRQVTLGWRGAMLGVVVGAVAAAGWAAEVPSTPGKVTFSDSEDDGKGRARVDVAVPTPMFQRRMDAPRMGGSSLDGVRAIPFAPPSSLSPSVNTRRLRDARSNWILEPGKNLDFNEDNAFRAFGVRSGVDFERLGEESDRPSNFWEAYFNKEKADAKQSRSPVRLDPMPNERMNRGELTPRFQPFEAFGSTEFEGFAPLSIDRDRSGVLFSDSPSRSSVLGTLGDALDSNSRRDLVRDSLNLTTTPPGAKPAGGAEARGEQFRRMLGIGLPTDPKPGASRAGVASVLPETGPSESVADSMDLIGVIADPTRRELNPVVARPAPGFDAGPKLEFVDTIGGMNSRPAAARRPLIDMGPVRSVLPATASADRSTGTAAPRTIYSPTTLEMPGRSF